MNSINPVNAQISDQAAKWVVRLDEGDLNQTEQTAFANWLLEGPAHLKEFLAISAIYEMIPLSRELHSIDVESLLEEHCPDVVTALFPQKDEHQVNTNKRSSKRWLPVFGVAASFLVFALVVPILFYDSNILSEKSGPLISYGTSIGELKDAVLEDGTKATLNTNTQISVNFSQNERGVVLHHGEVVFDVTNDQNRPFKVYINSHIIEVTGTVFNVQSDNMATIVTVVEGQVAVTPAKNKESSSVPVNSKSLRQGKQLTIAGSGRFQPVIDVDPETTIAWKRHQLVFESTRLSEVAKEFNRYNEKTILINNTALQDIPITGTFNAREPEVLMAFLQSSRKATINHSIDRFEILKPISNKLEND